MLSLWAHTLVMPARLARDPHAPAWFFEQSALAIRLFPLDHNLWRVPMELLATFPADKLPPNLSAEVLADVQRRDPQYFLVQNLDSL
jgi:hypothetical protein